MSAVAAPLDARPAARTGRRTRWRRPLLWGLLIALLGVAQGLLVFLALEYEDARAQDRTEAVASAAAAEARRMLQRDMQSLQLLAWHETPSQTWPAHAGELLRARRELLRIEERDAQFHIVGAVQAPTVPGDFGLLDRRSQSVEAESACAAARRTGAPVFSRSYYVPMHAGMGVEVVDLCLLPQTRDGDDSSNSTFVATLSLPALLEAALVADGARNHELSFVESDGARLARAGEVRGLGVYRSERVLDLPGNALQLRADSAEGRPHLIPNLSIALVLGLSLALTALVLLLARDVRRRALAEQRLASELALRRAMEDSLVTGLRARDLDGRITYVNPAFCRMVGFSVDELQGTSTPPYWPPEHAPAYADRQAQRLASGDTEARLGHETIFVRKSGERFPVAIYEAPLVDRDGRQTGWMSAAVDLTEQRRVEELSRQQQERLQATARLATVGEMASLLSHELNQPLAAIASYAAGSLNLLDAPDVQDEDREQLRLAATRIAEQADRAGRTIKSVHDFVRRREQAHEAVPAAALVEAVLPLVRLQARKSGTRLDVTTPPPTLRVRADRTMIEQVLLNLTRNGIQAMEGDATPTSARVLRIGVRELTRGWVEFAIADAGPGIAPEVAARLFTPFFTTRSEGMGLGLSLCRTVIEQHGGALDFDTGASGTTFRFTLRAA